jgi:hypothetical protein
MSSAELLQPHITPSCPFVQLHDYEFVVLFSAVEYIDG